MSMGRGKGYGNGWGSGRRGVWMDRVDRMDNSMDRMSFPLTIPVRMILFCVPVGNFIELRV
jgi:hypothetical protein